MPLLRRLLGSVSVVTVLCVLALIGLYQAWLAWTAPGRVEPGLIERATLQGSVPVAVVLPFKPERFHIAKIQAADGRIRRVMGNVIELRAITPDGIRQLAGNYYWIERINGL